MRRIETTQPDPFPSGGPALRPTRAIRHPARTVLSGHLSLDGMAL